MAVLDPIADIRVCFILTQMAERYVLDGTKITSLEGFYDHIGSSLGLDGSWGRNLDALDDVLSGGDHGVPEDGFTLTWVHSNISRANLGYPETVRQLEKRLLLCHSSNREIVRAELNNARQGKGNTVFDWLIDIIRDHEGNVRLVLA
jgi:RNAse (barnase) inhibitor barstar